MRAKGVDLQQIQSLGCVTVGMPRPHFATDTSELAVYAGK